MFLDPQGLLLSGLYYYLLPLVIILLIAALLAWRTYKRPNVLLCTIALLWVLFLLFATTLALVATTAAHNTPSDVIGFYCAQILGTVAGLDGVRGALAARRFRHLSPKGAV
jgi:hypothetical protein